MTNRTVDKKVVYIYKNYKMVHGSCKMERKGRHCGTLQNAGSETDVDLLKMGRSDGLD